MDLIAAGSSNKEIARRMGLTEGTVKIYLSTIRHKLGVRTRYELISSYWQERAGRCVACGAALPGAVHPELAPHIHR